MTPYDETGRGTMPTAGACEVGRAAQERDPAFVTIDNATLMYPHLLTPTTSAEGVQSTMAVASACQRMTGQQSTACMPLCGWRLTGM